MRALFLTAVPILLLALAPAAGAATIVINVADGPGEGFNDPSPPGDPTQRGNNPGTSLGELRLNLFEAAADVWAGILASNVTITVNARFDPLTCEANSATLGFAGAASSATGVPGGLANTRYPIALAESLANGNLNGSGADLVSGDGLLNDSAPCDGFGGSPPPVTGKIVLFDADPDCAALFQAIFTEFASGIGAIIASGDPQGDADVGGRFDPPSVTIPYVGTTQTLGTVLRDNLPGANVTLRRSSTAFVGETGGRVRMYAPAVFRTGSSVSHWSDAATPDLLMEPRLGAIGFDQVDLTVAAFLDMGWKRLVTSPVLIFRDAFEPSP